MSRMQIDKAGDGGPGATIADALALAIHEHRLAPGTRPGEDDLGRIHGVSRTMVRAALQWLCHGRLVDWKRNRGAHVAQETRAQPSVRAAREVFEALPVAPVNIDVPEGNAALIAWLEAGFSETFATARMYRGPAPVTGPRLLAIATMELG